MVWFDGLTASPPPAPGRVGAASVQAQDREERRSTNETIGF